ncbi:MULTISPECIES: hypothetical protein [unclassified Nocardia]|uniref:hypothetical protein n=1 Tax=unclassified Nocardia TaxID=2637762 RepID=UPI001CE4194B|nr:MULTISPECIES: hypothetical protein [unclassified Nocardia]
MTTLLARAETTKLARLLELSDPAAVEFLTALPPEAIRVFRERATDLLFDGEAARMKRIAAAARIVPTAISAKAAEHAFGPLLCAAVAGSVEPARAVEIARALPPKFLAEAATQLDPRRTAALLAEVPQQLVVPVARELLSRGDHLTMGRFVGAVPDEIMLAVAAMMDDADLLRIGFVMENKDSVDRLIGLVEDRLAGVIRAAAEQEMWAEGIDLLGGVGAANRARLGDLAAGLDGELLDGLIAAVHELDAWAMLLPVTGAMSEESLRAFVVRPAMRDEAVLARILAVALDHDLWLELLPLARQLAPEQLGFLAGLVAQKPDDELGELVRQADSAGHWAAMLPIALAMTAADRRRMAALPVMAEPAVLRRIIETTAEHELWPEALPLVDALPETAKTRLATHIAELTREQLLAAVHAAARGETVDTLVEIALAQDAAGRARILELVDGMDGLDDFLAALSTETPDSVWHGLIEVRAEIPGNLLAAIADRAASCDRTEVAGRLRVE